MYVRIWMYIDVPREPPSSHQKKHPVKREIEGFHGSPCRSRTSCRWSYK